MSSIAPPSGPIEEIRAAHMDALDESLDDLSEALEKRGRLAIERIKRSGYKRATILRETRAITRHTRSKTSEYLAESIRDAALMAERAAAVGEAWTIAERIKNEPDRYTAAQIRRARAFDGRAIAVDARAAVLRAKEQPLKSTRAQREAFRKYGARSGYRPRYQKTEGVKILLADREAGLIKSRREIGLSRRLHGSMADNTRRTERAISRIIREARSLDEAGRELIRETRGLGSGQGLTKPLERLQRAGRALAELGDGDKAAARREWRRAYREVTRTAERLADKRGGYRELKQILDSQGSKATDKALKRWLQEKQRYNSERIIETERMAAYRQREASEAARKPYITHFYWRLNRGARRQYVRRTKPRPIRRRGRKGGKKARRCVCETYADQRFPIAVARDYPRGGHPYCRCYFEYVYDTGKVMSTPPSQQDLEWFDSLPD